MLFNLSGITVPANILLITLLIYVLADKDIVNKLTLLFKDKIFWFLIIPFLLSIISLFYSDDYLRGWKLVETRLPLLIFPLVYGLTRIEENDFYLLLKATVVSVSALALIGFINQFFKYQISADTGDFYNDNLVSLLGKQAVYYAFYVNAALLIVYYLWHKKQIQQKVHKIITVAMVVILFISQYLLASRTSTIIMLLLVGGLMAYEVFKKGNLKRGLLIAGTSLVLITSLIIVFPKSVERFKSATNVEFTYDNPNPINHFNGEINEKNWNGLNTRIALWTCAIEEIQKSFLFGHGIGDAQQVLDKNYKDKNFILAIHHGYNTHNQYLDFMMSNGVIGLIGFLAFIGFFVVRGYQSKDVLLISFILVFSFSCLTENLLNRNQGVVFITLLLSIMAFNTKSKLIN